MEQQNNETESASVGSPGDSHDSNHPQIEKNAEKMNDSQASSASGQDESSDISSNEVETLGANPSQDPGGCDIPVESQNNEKESTSMTGHGDSPDSSHQQDEVKTKEADHEVDSLVADQTDSCSNSKMSADRDSVQDDSTEMMEGVMADPIDSAENSSERLEELLQMPKSDQEQKTSPPSAANQQVVPASLQSTEDTKLKQQDAGMPAEPAGGKASAADDQTGSAESNPQQDKGIAKLPADGKDLSADDRTAASDSKSGSGESSPQQESSTVRRTNKERNTDHDSDEENSSQSEDKGMPTESGDGKTLSADDRTAASDSKSGSGESSPQQPVGPVTPRDSSQFWIILFIVSVLVAFSAIVLVYWLGADVPPPAICNSQDRENCGRFFEENIHRLQEMYPKQDKNLWLTLYSAAVLHVSQNQKPIRPITVLVYSLSEDSKIIEEVSDLYETVLSGEKKNGKIVLDGSELSGKDPEEVHRIIAGSLEEGFKSGKKVAVVRDFDLLPSCSVLAFHNYCNNDDAPYLDVAIILTIRGTVDVGKAPKAKDLERTVGDILHKKWKDCPDDLPPDKIDAILSRIANNVVLVR